MKKTILASLSAAALLLPLAASAHQHATYMINGKPYTFVIGSLNEPTYVDDKSGVDFTVNGPGQMTMAADGDMDEGGAGVTGLEKTLKVEVAAGDKKKVFDLKPAFGKPGGYTANFFPTVATTYSYRFFGTIDNAPLDVTFTCNPAGHVAAPEDKSEVKISDKVMRTDIAGAFGCPLAKADAGFPEPAVSGNDVVASVASQTGGLAASVTEARNYALAGTVLGVLGILAGIGAWMRRKPQQM